MAVRAPARRQQRAPRSRPSLRVVPGKGKGRRSPVPIVIAVVLTVFAVAALHATMGQDGLKAAKLERDVNEQTEKLTLLRARVAQLSNPGRVATEAEKRGLVGSPDSKYVKVPLDDPSALDDTGPRELPPDPLKGLATR